MVLMLHILGFFAIIIPLWVMAPRGRAEVVLLEFVNFGGWPTTGLSSMIGLLAPMAVLVGYDCSVHMCKLIFSAERSEVEAEFFWLAEEIKDASVTLPRAIMASVVLNVTLVFIVIVTVCFTIGDQAEVAATPTFYPFIQMFYNATQSYAGTNVMTAIIIIMFAACAVSEVAAASRQVWAFARDAGLPGHRWLSRVSPGWNIPLPAVTVSLTISALLSLINIGSSVALNAITSLGAIATLLSYYLTIGCLLYRRLTGPELPSRRWSLGKWGMAINIAALAFLTPLIFFLSWPIFNPVTAVTMNWSSVMLVGTLIIAMTYYVVKGRKEYVGPSVFVKRFED
jgi:choline transport protein